MNWRRLLGRLLLILLVAGFLLTVLGGRIGIVELTVLVVLILVGVGFAVRSSRRVASH